MTIARNSLVVINQATARRVTVVNGGTAVEVEFAEEWRQTISEPAARDMALALNLLLMEEEMPEEPPDTSWLRMER